jgi:hypothetical protein
MYKKRSISTKYEERLSSIKYEEISIAALYNYTIVSDRSKMTYIFTGKTNYMPLQFRIEQCIFTDKCFLYEDEAKEEMTFTEAINRIYGRTFELHNNF